SAHLVARALGWTIERWAETIEPELGTDGRCLGVRQKGQAIVDGRERIVLELDMFAGAADPRDRVVLDSDPPLDVRVAGGTQGERGTVGTMVNALTRLARAPRGLVTVVDVFA